VKSTSLFRNAVALGLAGTIAVRFIRPMPLDGQWEPASNFFLSDAGRIRQVLRILLDNALKYTPAERDVELSVTRDAGEVRIVVRDSGLGIASEHVPRIFDRFYRIDQARSRAVEGTGLGLPIARALVTAHGGSINLTSIVGQGTTVTVSLPAQTRIADKR
jgi:signal transduction histidine kinase